MRSTIGRYTVTGELGRGAMGVVYSAVDPALDRPVAVKVISRSQTGDVSIEELEARFLREAKVAARINHPGVVTIHDVGHADNDLYLVMELVEGESLAQRLKRGAYFSPAEAFLLVAQIADAVGAAHSQGVIHRDIKPANILITRDGRVKVTDFGVAKALGDAGDLTRTGTVMGSPAYMAPEQARGEAVDARADLFSLGVMLYELLLRRRPFHAETFSGLIYKVINEDPLAQIGSAGLDEATVEFLRLALAKEAGQRVGDAATFASRARELAARLGGVDLQMTSVTQVMEPAAPTVLVKAPMPRRGIWLGAGVAAAIVLVVVGALLARRHPSGGQGSDEARGTAGETAAMASLAPTTVAAQEPTPVPTAVPVATPLGGEAEISHRLGMGFGASPETARAPQVSSEPRGPSQRAYPQPATEVAPPLATTAPPPATIAATYECRQGAQFNVTPRKAEVSIDGKLIGIVGDFGHGFVGRLGGKVYSFAGPGEYLVQFSLDGYRPVTVKVLVRPEAAKRLADIDLELKPVGAS